MLKRLQIFVAACGISFAAAFSHAATDSDQKVASDFWEWRARTGQYTGDDVTRMERPPGVVRNWSAAEVEKQRAHLKVFQDRWRLQDDPRAPVAQQVDHRLIGSALARVHWELDIGRNPSFQDQSP